MKRSMPPLPVIPLPPPPADLPLAPARSTPSDFTQTPGRKKIRFGESREKGESVREKGREREREFAEGHTVCVLFFLSLFYLSKDQTQCCKKSRENRDREK